MASRTFQSHVAMLVVTAALTVQPGLADQRRSTPTTPSKVTSQAPADKDGLTEEERAIVSLTNQQRKAAGLAELTVNAKLMSAARSHSLNMARQNQLAHRLDGKGPSERITEQGYAFFTMGENCAQGQTDAREATQSWLASPGHRANMLNSSFAEIGVGVATSSTGERFWTQVFAKTQAVDVGNR